VISDTVLQKGYEDNILPAAYNSAAQSSVAVWQQPDRYRLSSLSRGYWTNMNQITINAGRFDVAKIAATLPETATTSWGFWGQPFTYDLVASLGSLEFERSWP
jgi:hypothetical protein